LRASTSLFNFLRSISLRSDFIACYLTYFLTCNISTFSPMIERKFPSWRNSGRHTKRIIGKLAFFGKLQLDTTDKHLVFHSVTRIDAGLKTIAKDLLLPLLNVRLSISKVNGSNFCSKTHIFTKLSEGISDVSTGGGGYQAIGTRRYIVHVKSSPVGAIFSVDGRVNAGCNRTPCDMTHRHPDLNEKRTVASTYRKIYIDYGGSI